MSQVNKTALEIPGNKLLVVVGATASGKTWLAVQLAKHYQGEIISADSRQVYRGLNIGSGKDLQEYDNIPYHLIDIVDPGYEFNIFDFQRRFVEAFEDISQRRKLPLLAGGSGLYLEAALKGYQMIEVNENPNLREQLAPLSQQALAEYLLKLKPRQHNSSDLNDRQRLVRAIEIAEAEQNAKREKQAHFPQIEPLILGIRWDRRQLRLRITQRLKQRLEEGMIDEVEQLHLSGVSWQTLEFYGLEYRFISQHLQGTLNKNDMFQKLNAAIHKFAKRQDTWFRRMEKNGSKIHWLDGEDKNKMLSAALEITRPFIPSVPLRKDFHS